MHPKTRTFVFFDVCSIVKFKFDIFYLLCLAKSRGGHMSNTVPDVCWKKRLRLLFNLSGEICSSFGIRMFEPYCC